MKPRGGGGLTRTPSITAAICLPCLASLPTKAWNYEGENLLRACPDVEYTIVRPGVMSTLEEDDTPPASLALADDGGDLKVCVRRATAPTMPSTKPTIKLATMLTTYYDTHLGIAHRARRHRLSLRAVPELPQRGPLHAHRHERSAR